MNRGSTEVVAALICEGDRFLICQRPTDKARPDLWEFVGGKVEPGETHREALIRECNEELGVTIEVGTRYMDVLHNYPDLAVHLILYRSWIVSGRMEKREHQDIRWITPEEIQNYSFCPADESILIRLQMEKC